MVFDFQAHTVIRRLLASNQHSSHELKFMRDVAALELSDENLAIRIVEVLLPSLNISKTLRETTNRL